MSYFWHQTFSCHHLVWLWTILGDLLSSGLLSCLILANLLGICLRIQKLVWRVVAIGLTKRSMSQYHTGCKFPRVVGRKLQAYLLRSYSITYLNNISILKPLISTLSCLVRFCEYFGCQHQRYFEENLSKTIVTCLVSTVHESVIFCA